MEKEIYAIGILFLLLIIINYNFLDSKLKDFLIEKDFGVVERIIDGDTIIINGTSIRLLGINCPEKSEEFSLQAKEFLEKKILNKTIRIEFGKQKTDKYGRTLAYVFLGNENINLALIKEGFANPYFPKGQDKYSSQFYKAWKECKKNYCEKSKNKCANCIKLKKLDYNTQKVILENICSFDCNLTNWIIKDEGRKKFRFENFILKPNKEVKIVVGKGEGLVWKGQKYVWTKTGDTLFLRDNQNRLVLYKHYL